MLMPRAWARLAKQAGHLCSPGLATGQQLRPVEQTGGLLSSSPTLPFSCRSLSWDRQVEQRPCPAILKEVSILFVVLQYCID